MKACPGRSAATLLVPYIQEGAEPAAQSVISVHCDTTLLSIVTPCVCWFRLNGTEFRFIVIQVQAC